MSLTATNAQEATWTCHTCGTIEPQFYRGQYLRQPCRCQIAAEKARESAKVKEQQDRNHQQGLINISYNWLGNRWSDTDLTQKTFDNFQADRQQKAQRLARVFVEKMQGTLILHGGFGVGKTHLLAAICNELRARDKESRFTTAPKLFKAMQEAIQRKEDSNLIIHKAVSTPLLVIDDIDKARWSEFREETYFDIIDERVRKGLPVAISTNRYDTLVDYVGGAVCDRLQVGRLVVEMTGESYRLTL